MPDAMTAGVDPAIEALKRRGERMRGDRGTLNSHLDEVREIIYPQSARFTGTDTAGEKKMQKVYDTTGITASELLASSWHGTASNPASKWFSLRMADDELMKVGAVKEWLGAVEKKCYSRMYAPGTNLVPATHEFYLQLAPFGTAVMFKGRTNKGTLLFQTRSLSECYIAENADGVVDTLFRFYTQTVKQCMEDPDWSPSEKVRKLYAEGKFEDTVEIVHAVYPRPDSAIEYNSKGKRKRGKKNMAFASRYFERSTCHMLEEGGFVTFPYIVARLDKAAGETYGRGRGMVALPDVKMLQIMMAENIKVLQKMGNPIRWLKDDGVTGQVRNIPGTTNFYRGNPNEGIMLEPTTDKLPVVHEEMDNLRNRIRTIFYNDTLQIVDDREMTLGEARMRRMERLRLQGPSIGRLAAEFLGPLVEGVYAELDAEGEIPPAPEEIDGKIVTVEFVSPLANAQKQEELGGFSQMLEYFTPLGEIGLEWIKRKLNGDRTVEYFADTLNVDHTIFNTEDEIKQLDDQTAQQTQIASAEPVANAANAGAGAIKQLADANAGGGVDMSKLAAIAGQAALQGQQPQRAA